MRTLEREPTIATAAARLAAGALTAADLVDASLAAIAEHGARTNAFTSIDADGARRAARALDEERASGLCRGPLHGIPISLKDLIDVAGVTTTAGSRVLAGRTATRTATVVTRLTEAGAIVIGRTNLHEFAFGTTSEDSAFGPVHHPLDPARSAGGSSGGSAAAVATGMGLASIGTDTGGSVRIPAALCGVVGLKPGAGEIPTDGVVPLSPSLDHVGPLARCVQDAAWVYAVMAGRSPAIVNAAAPRGLRLARLSGYFDAVERSVADAFERAMARLGAAGMTMARTRLADADRISERYLQIVLPEAAHGHARTLDAQPNDYTQPVRDRLLFGRTILAVDHLAAQAFRAELRASVDALLAHADALVLPAMPMVAPPFGTTHIELGRGQIPLRAAMLRHTQPFNLTGHPAITLPLPGDGLPVGLQLVGRLGDTDGLLATAAACEALLSP